MPGSDPHVAGQTPILATRETARNGFCRGEEGASSGGRRLVAQTVEDDVEESIDLIGLDAADPGNATE